MTTQPVRRVGRPSNLSRVNARYTPAPPLAPLDAATAMAELARIIYAAGQTIQAASAALEVLAAVAPPPTPPAADGWLSLGEAAQLTRLGRTTLARWVEAGRLPALHGPSGLYKPYRIRRSDLDGLVAPREGAG